MSQIDDVRSPDAPHRGRARRRWALVGATVMAVVGAAVATQLAVGGVGADGAAPGHPASARPNATSPVGAQPSPTTTPLDAAHSPRATAGSRVFPGDAAVTDAVESALQTELAVLGNTTDRAAVLGSLQADTSVTANPFTESLKAAAQEYDAMGWRQTGAPRVEWVELLTRDEDATPPSVQVLACLDSSGVDVTDEQGNSLRGAATPTRSAQVLTLVDDEQGWKVIGATFPEDPEC